MRIARSVSRLLLSFAVLFTLGLETGLAQNASSKKPPKLPDLFNQGGKDLGEFRSVGPKLSASMKPAKVKAGDMVTVFVTLELPPQAHIAPQKSDSKFGLPTKFTVKKLTGLTPAGKEFVATSQPTSEVDAQTGEKLVYFAKKVTWTRQFKVSSTEDSSTVSLDGSLRYQICAGGQCQTPKSKTFQASAQLVSASSAAKSEPAKDVHPFSFETRPKQFGKLGPIKLKFAVTPKDAKPGDKVTVSIAAELDDGWNAYALTNPKGGIGLPVVISVSTVRGLKPVGKGWRPDKAPKEAVEEKQKIQKHYGKVTWSRQFEVVEGIAAGAYGISGRLRYQVCEKAACKPPKTVSYKLGDLRNAAPAPEGSNTIDRSPFKTKKKTSDNNRLTKEKVASGKASSETEYGKTDVPMGKPPVVSDEYFVSDVSGDLGEVALAPEGSNTIDRSPFKEEKKTSNNKKPAVKIVASTKSESRTKTGKTGAPEKKPPVASEQTADIHGFTFSVTPKRGNISNGYKSDPIHLRFELKPEDAKPGDEVTVSITADIDEKWHAFALTNPTGGIGLPVEITVQNVQGLVPTGKGWRSTEPPMFKKDDNGDVVQEHEGTVTWERTFRVADNSEPGKIGISGRIRYQLCIDKRCLPPKSQSFKLGDLTKAVEAPSGSNDIDRTPYANSATETNTGSLAYYLLLAFVGGLILNIMPCVLPVIAIKVMSFVQQAGENRGRVFMLNSVYSAGVISVFLALATLAAVMGVGWGQQFQSVEFTVFMGIFVFAMGLSLLGIYEIPLPGFLGSAAGKQHSEGPGGAFLTGVFATILATPCSGPFLGVTLAWSVRQPVEVIYLVWGTMGLGMASPYLLFAMVPAAVKILPKPGQWMVRFKEISGFVLMGTTVWIIRSLTKAELVFILVALSGIAFSLWMIGNLYLPTTPRKQKWQVRSIAIAVTLFALFGGSHALEKSTDSRFFSFLQRPDLLAGSILLLGITLTWWIVMSAVNSQARRGVLYGTAAVLFCSSAVGSYYANSFAVELPWKPYSKKALDGAISDGKVVLIDFTADWCTTCKTVERFALNRKSTLDMVNRHNIVVLKADCTRTSDEIQKALEKYNSISIPLTVIVTPDDPENPIILRDVYTKGALLEKLEEAVARRSGKPKAASGTGTQQSSLR